MNFIVPVRPIGVSLHNLGAGALLLRMLPRSPRIHYSSKLNIILSTE